MKIHGFSSQIYRVQHSGAGSSNKPESPGDSEHLRTTALYRSCLSSTHEEPSWLLPALGSSYHVQLLVRVLQGHEGRLLQLFAHDLEEVQRCHLNGAKQEGLLGSGVLDVCPARFLGRGMRVGCER